MSKNFSRSALIRKASKLPKGSKERRSLLAGLGDTWGRRVNDLKNEFMKEIVAEAVQLIKSEGGTASGHAVGVVGEVTGNWQGHDLSLRWQWDRKGNIAVIESEMTLDRDQSVGRHQALSMAPMNIAAESLYKHFFGLLP